MYVFLNIKIYFWKDSGLELLSLGFNASKTWLIASLSVRIIAKERQHRRSVCHFFFCRRTECNQQKCVKYFY